LASYGQSVHLFLGTNPDTTASGPPTTVTLNYQGPIDLLEAAVTGLDPTASYTLGLVPNLGAPAKDFQPLATFQTNAAGAQIVESLGPLRQVVPGSPQQENQHDERRFLEIVPAGGTQPVQVQLQVQ
jgi:hypothetical protein